MLLVLLYVIYPLNIAHQEIARLAKPRLKEEEATIGLNFDIFSYAIPIQPFHF